MEKPVTLADIQEAKHRIANIAYRTPLYHSPRLSEISKTQVYLKLESYQPIRVFKIRGAANKILKIPSNDRARGLVAASSGNHGLAVAYVAYLLRNKATIVVPTTAVVEKVQAIKEYHAEVIKHGLFHDERLSKALEIQKSTSAIFIPPFDDPDVIAGQGTAGLEVLEDLPDVDVVMTPVGGGGLISGIATAIKSLKPEVRVVGVEPERASSMHESILKGNVTKLEDTRTIADGLATREPGKLTFEIARKLVDELLLVTEQEIEKAVFTVFHECHIVIEPSAAVVVAALIKNSFPNNAKVVLVVSGGNISMNLLTTLLSKYGQNPS